jgi:RIP homotypic interaction motif
MSRGTGEVKRMEPVTLIVTALAAGTSAGALDALKDDDLVAAAKTLLELVDQSGAKSGKYNVTIKDSHGVQVGDGNFQVNKF